MDNCTTCLKTRHRLSQCGPPDQQAKKMTPPPSRPGSPVAMSSSSPSPSTLGQLRRTSEASEALNQAFVNEDSEDEEPGSSSLLPRSCYRTPTRSSSDSNSPRRKSPTMPTSSTARMPTRQRGSDDSVRTSRSLTPEIRSPDAGYSPMAAGFARLSLDSVSDPAQARARSTRATFDLEAKMFSGPA